VGEKERILGFEGRLTVGAPLGLEIKKKASSHDARLEKKSVLRRGLPWGRKQREGRGELKTRTLKLEGMCWGGGEEGITP